MTTPGASAVAFKSASFTDPPGWMSATASCFAAASRQSRKGKKASEATTLPGQRQVRTRQIIAYETGVVKTADPVGGSYHIEQLTDRIERAAEDYIRRIDEMGGTLQAIAGGFIQNEIQGAAYEFQREIERGERVIVGVNRFQTTKGEKAPVFRIDPDTERGQVERVRALRAGPNNAMPT